MIVICTGCQARFRVADEKVGPRGAKVRCSRCQTVFVVRREVAAPTPPPVAPKVELDLTPGLRGPAQAAARAGASVIPFPAPAQPPAPSPDPFAAAGLDAFGEPAPGTRNADDPFARVPPPAGNLSPVGLRPGELGQPMTSRATPTPPADDPFAQAGLAGGGGFGSIGSGTTGAQSLPVTDLAQILGAAGPAAIPPVAASPAAFPEDVSQPGLDGPGFEAPSLDGPGSDQAGGDAARLDVAGMDFSPPAAPPVAPAVPAERQPRSTAFSADLSLEEHSAPDLSAPFADPSDVVASAEAAPAPTPSPGGPAGAAGYGSGGAAFEAGPLDGYGGPEESLALATEPTPGPPEPEPAEAPSAAPAPAPRPAVAATSSEAEDEELEVAAGLRPEPPVQRLRAAAVNALALVALLAIALAFRVVWHGDASLGPSALRPSTLMRSFGRAPPAAGDLEVTGVRTGVYQQSAGGTLLFVRGEVVSRARGPVRAVRVEAELVRDGQVVARGDIQAGVVPTPEEVDRATDNAGLEALAAAVRSRAPRSVAPGDRLAFLVTLGDAPADVNGTTVRVHARVDDADP